MSKQVLKLISDGMKSMGIAYGFGEYAGHPVIYPYAVGEYQETEGFTEDGLQEASFLLTLFHRGTWEELENTREKIENHFNRISGMTVITDNGSGVAIFYANSLIVPTGDAELKSMQINLNVKEWKVN